MRKQAFFLLYSKKRSRTNQKKLFITMRTLFYLLHNNSNVTIAVKCASR